MNKKITILIAVIIILLISVAGLYLLYFSKKPITIKENINVSAENVNAAKELTPEEKVNLFMAGLENYFETGRVIDLKVKLKEVKEIINTLDTDRKTALLAELADKQQKAIANGEDVCQKRIYEKVANADKFIDTNQDNFFTIIAGGELEKNFDFWSEMTLNKFALYLADIWKVVPKELQFIKKQEGEVDEIQRYITEGQISIDYHACLATEDNWYRESCKDFKTDELYNKCRYIAGDVSFFDFVFGQYKDKSCADMYDLAQKDLGFVGTNDEFLERCKLTNCIVCPVYKREGPLDDNYFNTLPDKYPHVTISKVANYKAWYHDDISYCGKVPGADKAWCEWRYRQLKMLENLDQDAWSKYKAETELRRRFDSGFIGIQTIMEQNLTKGYKSTLCTQYLTDYLKLNCQARRILVTEFLGRE